MSQILEKIPKASFYAIRFRHRLEKRKVWISGGIDQELEADSKRTNERNSLNFECGSAICQFTKPLRKMSVSVPRLKRLSRLYEVGKDVETRRWQYTQRCGRESGVSKMIL